MIRTNGSRKKLGITAIRISLSNEALFSPIFVTCER